MTTPQAVDQIISARWIVPVDPANQVLECHCVVVRDGLIVDVLPIDRAREQYSANEFVDLSSHALIPGLINLHTHAAMTLMRGLADDLPLMRWLNEHIWPAEAKHVSGEFVYDGTLIACAEMIQGGITCFNDMYMFPGSAAQAVLESGMRAVLGLICLEFPTRYATDAQDYLRKGLAVRDQFRHEPTLSYALAPHAPYTVSDRSFQQILLYADELELPIHLHLHETDEEIRESLTRFGVRPIERLHRLGLICPNLIAVHAVHLNDSEIELLALHAASAAHCPSSNLKLASGIAPVSRFLEAELNTGLGTDGAASNNRLDLFEEMRLAALLAKANTGRADRVPAHAALHMATLGGARALGLDDHIGSITIGKAADLCAVNFASIAMSPVYHPISHLVYAAGRSDVSDVWVNGRRLLRQGTLTQQDEHELRNKAATWQTRMTEQS
ncbi:MAG: TRZ/ATZ family hydrolase [Betaproteobacteria bacterium]